MTSKKGSALIMILLIVTSITLLAMTVLKSTIAFNDLVGERLAFIQQEKIVEALILYGIAARYHQGEKQESQTYTFTQWPPPDGTYQGKVTIECEENGWKIRAHIYRDNKEISMKEHFLVAKYNECIKNNNAPPP